MRLKPTPEERCAEYEKFGKIDSAFRTGDWDALSAAVDEPEALPNGHLPTGIGLALEYAIYHSPLPFIRTLLEKGADPRPADHDGFPPLIAALSCSRPQPGSPGRTDLPEVLRLLLSYGCDPEQRGVNDWTALHMAVAERNVKAVEILLEAGADPNPRTRIDDCDTPLEMAESLGLSEIAALLSESKPPRHG